MRKIQKHSLHVTKPFSGQFYVETNTHFYGKEMFVAQILSFYGLLGSWPGKPLRIR